MNPSSDDFREFFLNDVTTKINDEQFVSNSRTEYGRKGFARIRRLTFAHLIVLLVQGLSRSIQRELNSFYQRLQNEDFPIQYVVKSSFSKARAKLNYTAFVELNKTGTDSFYNHASYKTWQGLRLLAIDGTTAVLPRSKDIEAEFGITRFGPYADSPRSVARCSILYDVLNLTVLDGQIDKYNISEKQLACRHFCCVNAQTDLILFDRGYPGLDFMWQMEEQKILYLIRMRDDWWLEVRKMLDEGRKDKVVCFTTQSGKSFQCRLIAATLPDGSQSVYITNLMDEQQFPASAFADLYHQRWNIEEGYKLFKTRAELERFSGKTALSVRQDFYAKIFMMTAAAVLAFPIEERIKREKRTRKHSHKVNRTNALAAVKECFWRLILEKKIRHGLAAIDTVLARTTELVRPGRTNPRKKIKKKPPSSTYKHL